MAVAIVFFVIFMVVRDVSEHVFEVFVLGIFHEPFQEPDATAKTGGVGLEGSFQLSLGKDSVS